jgi:carnitine-CoA ligase
VSNELPEPKDAIVRYLLERNAAERPDAVAVTFEDGQSWTRQQALQEANAAANALRAAGVRQGDAVAVFLPNGPDFLRAWWGANTLGAVVMPINLAFRGASLSHTFDVGRPVAVISDHPYAERLAGAIPGRCSLLPAELLRGTDVSSPELERPVELWDPFALILTSGTTGLSKLSANSYHQLYVSGTGLVGTWGGTADDVALVNLPLFHYAAMYFTLGALAVGARIAVRTRVSLDQYWEVARDTGATIGYLLSTMVPYLLGQPARPAEREHRLRLMNATPLPVDIEAFQKRFGIADITTGYGATEVPGALCRVPGQPLVPGYCGRPRDGFEVRLADEHDIEVPTGEVGQIMVRTNKPWMISLGYVNDPAATAAAWRNGWFHTGDLLRKDADGNYFYVDRLKDALRRRGENISSFEVEQQVTTFPGVAEAACVADRSDVAVDDDVKVWIVPSPGAVIDFAELLRHCVDNLPHFAVPRYFQLIDALPKTASARVQKYSLRERGNTADTWDREQHGLTVTRDGLVTAPRRRSALCPFLGPARAELQCAARPEFLDLVVC